MRARFGMTETPTALWVFAMVEILAAVIWFAARVGSHPALTIALVPVQLLLLALALRGNRAVWVLLTAGSALALLDWVVYPQFWWRTPLAVITLACLLAPQSRKFVWRPRQGPVSLGSPPVGEVGEPSVAESGWYIDPGFPRRMRHWDAETRRWSGIARTPRALRKQWQQQRDRDSAGPA